MDNPTYFMLSKQVAAFNNLNVTANNVANANTPGFKKEQMIFKNHLANDKREQISFPQDIATTIDLKSGGLIPTERALDVALNGSGFFILNTPNGVRYTRHGNFHINSENMLVDAKGNFVLTADNQPILFEEGDGPPAINQDGTITVNNEIRGTIGVVEFSNPNLVRKSPEGFFLAEVAPQVKEDPIVVQGMVEGSNVNSIEEMVKLTEAQKATTTTSNLINDLYNMQRSTYKVYSKVSE